MTKDDIINRMQKAGLKAPARGDFIFIHWDQLALLLSHEIEACAKVCEDYDDEYDVHTKQTAKGIALQIRARGQA